MKAFPTTNIYQCVYLVRVLALSLVQGCSPGVFLSLRHSADREALPHENLED